MKRELTVIIPCKNEEGYIGNLLEDLNNQIGFTNLPVVVADANSTDGTRQVVERFQSRDTNLDIKIIEGGPVSVGRNRGARIADSKYLLFIDADVRLYSIETLFNTWQTLNLNPHLRLLTCRLKSYSPSILSKVAFSLYNLVHKVLVRKYPFAIGAYFFLRKEDSSCNPPLSVIIKAQSARYFINSECSNGSTTFTLFKILAYFLTFGFG